MNNFNIPLLRTHVAKSESKEADPVKEHPKSRKINLLYLLTQRTPECSQQKDRSSRR